MNRDCAPIRLRSGQALRNDIVGPFSFACRLRIRSTAPKKIERDYGGRFEIVAVAAPLRNDMWGVFLQDTGRRAAAGLAMTGKLETFVVAER